MLPMIRISGGPYRAPQFAASKLRTGTVVGETNPPKNRGFHVVLISTEMALFFLKKNWGNDILHIGILTQILAHDGFEKGVSYY